MNFGKFFLLSLLLLIIISIGFVSASEDINGTDINVHADCLSVESSQVSNVESDDVGNESVQEDIVESDLLSYSENEVLNLSSNSEEALYAGNPSSTKINTHFVGRIINLDMPSFGDINNNFYYGSPFRVGLKLVSENGGIPTGNVTAIVDGNEYQGIFGDYKCVLPSYSVLQYNYYFEITNYSLGENVIEFIYSGDSEYNGCSKEVTWTSVMGSYNNSDYNESKKNAYFSKIFNPEKKGFDYNHVDFIYGKPLIIALDLNLGNNKNPKGNVTAVLNGNVYQGIFGEYATYGYYENNPDIPVIAKTYNCLIEVTSYNFGNNVIEFIYSGDDEYNSCSQLINFYPFIDDYEFGWDVGVHSGYGCFGESIHKYFNLYNATGNLTVISNGIATTYNLSGERIKHEFTNFTIKPWFTGFKLNNYTLIYSGDEKYSGFTIQLDDVTMDLAMYYTENLEREYYVGDIPEINLYLGNATGNVTFIVNNNRCAANIVNGVAYVQITNYSLGYNKINIEYSGDMNYPSFSYKDNFNSYGFTVLPKHDLNICSCLVQCADANCVVIQIFDEIGLIGNCSINLCIDGNNVMLDLVNGVGIYNLSQSSVDYIRVDYDGDNKYYPVSSSNFIKWDDNYIVNKNNYMFYFNQAKGGELFYWIPSGVTLDIQGTIFAPGTYFNVNKPLNIISSTHDAVIDFNTTAGSLLGENPGSRFAISHGGSGTNVTGIYIHNTQVWLENVSNVILDNISVVVEDQRVGSGVGATSIRSNSSYVTVKNSYFYTRNNGGSATFVFAWAHHCTFDNNTVVTGGEVGNLIYETRYNVEIPEDALVVTGFHNITNNNILSDSGSIICWAIVMSSYDSIIENNTINIKGRGITGQWSGSYDDLYTSAYGRIVGNTLLGGCDMYVSGVAYDNYVSGNFDGLNGIFYNNTVVNDVKITDGTLFNNTIGGFLEIRNNCFVYDNIICNDLSINGLCTVQNNTINGDIRFYMQEYGNFSGVQINDNIINGDIMWNRGLFQHYLDVTNLSIVNNTIYGSINSLKSDSNKIINNTILSTEDYAIDLTNCRNNLVSGNIIKANVLYGNNAIKNIGNNIVENNCPINSDLNISAENIYVGDSLHINTVINENVSGNVEVIVNGKVYTIKANGNVSVEDLPAGCYIVTARYIGDDYFGPAEESIMVNVSKFSPVLEITLSDAIIGEDVLVSMNIFGATGNVNIIVDGEENIISLNNGVAKYTIENIGAGSHSIVAIYNGDERNEAAHASKNIILKEIFTKITDITIDGDLNINATLKDEEGNPIGNATINYVINNLQGTVTTDLNGAFTIQGQKNSKVEITYNGTNVFRSTSTSVTLDNVVPFKVACQFDANKLTCYAVDTAAGEKGALYKVVLKDALGNLIANADVQFVLNGVTYNTKTDENGVAYCQVNINKANTYTCTVKYFGDSKHDETAINSKIIVNKKTTTLTAKATTFKVKIKTKKFTVTLKTIKGSSANGKIYFSANKKVTLKVGGKTYVAKTNKNGKVTFKITKLNKKGKYNAVIKFTGDNTYNGVTKKVKIKVK